MSAHPYRGGPTQARTAPRASWWRLVGAWWRGVPTRLDDRRVRREMREACRHILHLVATGTHEDALDFVVRGYVERFRGRHKEMMRILEREMRAADPVTQLSVSLAKDLGELRTLENSDLFDAIDMWRTAATPSGWLHAGSDLRVRR